MTDKPAWMYRQSAVVPYLWCDERLHVVLITSARSGAWGIPKGVIEQDLSPAESAAKEALEEAGVLGQLTCTVICEYSYDKWGGTCHVQVYPLLVTELLSDWDEAELRDRTLVPLAVALDMVKPVLVPVLARLREYAEGLEG